jgi:sugar (pentulose or hexulose) kinase
MIFVSYVVRTAGRGVPAACLCTERASACTKIRRNTLSRTNNMSTTPRDGKGKVILSIDIGSSSVRCSAYSFLDNAVEALMGCSSSRRIQAAAAGTGKETVDLLLKCVDSCVDETLEHLRQKEQQNSNFRVVAVGFSAFVMNLVGINNAGNPVDGAMLTYSCNSPLVTQECQSLRT